MDPKDEINQYVERRAFSLRAVTNWPESKARKAIANCINRWRSTEFVIQAMATGLGYRQALKLEKQKAREQVLAQEMAGCQHVNRKSHPLYNSINFTTSPDLVAPTSIPHLEICQDCGAVKETE